MENSAHHPPSHHNISGRHLKDERCLLGQLAHPTGEQHLPRGGHKFCFDLVPAVFFSLPFYEGSEVAHLPTASQQSRVTTSTFYVHTVYFTLL